MKIITELNKDGRLSNIKLARKLGVNVLTITRRIKNLTENGIIEIKVMPNIFRMGYHAAFICLNVDQSKIDSICSRLEKIHNINLLVTCFGRFDVLMLVIYRDLNVLEKLVNTRLPQIAGIRHINQYLVAETTKMHNELISPTDSTTACTIILDEINRKLVHELLKDAQPNYRKLAESLDISTATISRRISFLIQEKMISFRAIPSLIKLGYLASAFVILQTEYKKIDAICEKLSSHDEVHLVTRLMNDNNVLFGIHCSDVESLYEFIKNVTGIDGVLNSETFVRGPVNYFNSVVFLEPG